MASRQPEMLDMALSEAVLEGLIDKIL
jgi:hypothetical protein